MTYKLMILGLLLGMSGVAHSQPLVDLSNVAPAGTPGSLWVASFDPTDATAPISLVGGRGVKVGEGTVIHPAVGLGVGYDSNVFFTDTSAQGAGVSRLLAQVAIGSLPLQRLHPGEDPMAGGMGEAKPSPRNSGEGDFQYEAAVRVIYDQMLSGNGTVNDTSGTGVGAFFHGFIAPQDQYTLQVDDYFARVIRPQNFETSVNANRDVNVGSLRAWWTPYDHAISGYVYYYNVIDVFENNLGLYPNRMFNRVGIHPSWLRLPKTRLYADVSISDVTGIGNDAASMKKATSYPFDATVGVMSLLNLRTSLSFAIGYTNGLYQSGPSYSSVDGSAMFAFRYAPTGQVGIGYSLNYHDSVNANFYRDHVIQGYVIHNVAPLVFMVAPELHLREYQGLTVIGNSPTRDDTIFALVAGIHYAYRDWLGIVLDYRLSDVSTDFRYMDATGQQVNPSYLNNEVMLGVRAEM